MPRKSAQSFAKNNQARLDNYYWYTSHGICPECAKRYAEPGRTLCETCKKRIAAQRERNDPGGVKRKAYNAQRRAALKAKGLCIGCGKAKAVEGKTRCAKCEEKMKDSRRKWEILQRIEREAQKARERSGRQIGGGLK